jgi:hypothetical protein
MLLTDQRQVNQQVDTQTRRVRLEKVARLSEFVILSRLQAAKNLSRLQAAKNLPWRFAQRDSSLRSE